MCCFDEKFLEFGGNQKGHDFLKIIFNKQYTCQKEAREDVAFDFDYAPFYRFAGKRSDGGDMGTDPWVSTWNSKHRILTMLSGVLYTGTHY